MNCLTVMPDQNDNMYSFTETYFFPLGPGYITAALKNVPGLHVFSVNLNHDRADISTRIKALLLEHDIDAVFCGGLCTLLPSVKKVFEAAKQFNPEIITVTGGGLITGAPVLGMEALEYADYGIIGEGEVTVAELAGALAAGGDVFKVPGLIFKDDRQWHFTGPRQEVADLGRLPWCDYDAFEFGRYVRDYKKAARCLVEYGHDVAYMLSSRSCPYRCTFCYHPEGEKYRKRPLDDLFAEVAMVSQKHGVDFIYFVDEVMASSPSYLDDFCRQAAGAPIKGWSNSFRVTDISPASIRKLKKAGCKGIFLGLESACDHILKSMNKGSTRADIERALSVCRDERMPARGSLIFGDPEETYESALATLAWWQSHPDYAIDLRPLIAYPGTEVYARAVREGRIRDPLAFLKAGCPPVNISKMSDEEYRDLIFAKLPDMSGERQAGYPDYAEVRFLEADLARGVASVAGLCHICGHVTETVNFDLDLTPCLYCQECGRPHRVPAHPERLANAAWNMEFIFNKFNKLAFYGIGGIFARASRFDFQSHEEVHLVDARFGRRFKGKLVEDKAVLREKNIDFVVAGVPARLPVYEQIRREAEECWGVKNVIDLTSFMASKLQM